MDESKSFELTAAEYLQIHDPDQHRFEFICRRETFGEQDE